jgi:uncharacterized protein (TIGR03083 family)
MEQTSPARWFEALRSSCDRLQSVAGPLDLAQLEQRSYASEWSIAQVLSHIGSQAEIFGLFLDAGLTGKDPPGSETFGPIWDLWNAKDPQAQAADALRADDTITARFEALDPDQRAQLRLQAFGRDLDATGLARMRLGEHAVHTWDVAVALDPSATIAPDAVDLLIDTIGPLSGWTAKPDGKQRRLLITTTDPERHFVLETGDALTLTESDGEEGLPELRLPAEALIRLVYGRLDPDHTPPVQADDVDLDDLRQLFPGF